MKDELSFFRRRSEDAEAEYQIETIFGVHLRQMTSLCCFNQKLMASADHVEADTKDKNELL